MSAKPILLPPFRNLLRRVAPAAVPLLGLLPLAGCGDASRPVVFGLAGPFAQSYGQSMEQGAQLAAKEINASGGIRGRELTFRVRDDGASPERAIAVAEELFSDEEVIAVVGHVNSGAMIEAGAIYGRGLPALATSATSPAISRLGPWVYRVASSDSANAVALAQLAHRTRARTAIFYENDGYGRGLAESFRSALQAAGGAVLEANPYLATTADFTPYLERLRRAEVDLIFVAGLEDGAARMIEQARGLGMETRFYGGDGLEGLMTQGPRFDGTGVGMLFHPDQSPRARAFAQRFEAEYGREPDSFAALGYDAVHLLARAATDGGRSRKAIRGYLESVGRPNGEPPFDGVSGTIRFDENGDPAGKEFAIGTIRNGRIVLEEDGR